MSNKNLHIVQKQVINVTLPNTNAALDWELNQRQGFTAIINDQLEKCFDEYDSHGNHLIIDKLDIDLGIFSSDNLNAQLPERLYAELKKKIDLISRQAQAGNTSSGSGSRPKDSDRFFNEQQGKLQALFFFLQKGYLPWWGSSLSDWDSKWVQEITQNEISDIKNYLVARGGRVIKRMAVQFNDDFINYLLQGMGVTTNAKEAWNWLVKILKKREPEFVERPSEDGSLSDQGALNMPGLRSKYWYDWIAYAIGQSSIPSLNNLFHNQPDILNFIGLDLMKIPGGKKEEFYHNDFPAIWKEELKTLEKEAFEKKQGLGVHNSTALIDQDIITPIKEIGGATPAEENILWANEQTIGSEPIISKQAANDITKPIQTSKEESEALFVNDAGLILLHPFLPELFMHCAWLNKKIFLNNNAQTMAVYAMYYLATGETEAVEHKLLFPKFLAGISWEIPLEPVEILNEKERNACDQLLREVLKHWKPLQNTSPEGLQEAYLQRNGKLEHIDSGWHLSIEYKTLDVLLNRLPWGTSLIKFPWMPEMLTVSWQ